MDVDAHPLAAGHPPGSRRGRVWSWGAPIGIALAVGALVILVFVVAGRRDRLSPPSAADQSPCGTTRVTDASPHSRNALRASLTVDYDQASTPGPDLTVTGILGKPSGGPLEVVRRCQIGTISLVGSRPGTPNQPGRVREGHVTVRSTAHRGLLQFVDSPTSNREHDNGSGAIDFMVFTGWYVTFADPQPGTYRTTQPITWLDPSTGSPMGRGRVTVTIVIARTR